MTSFRSKHYPGSGKSFLILQEYAMRYYGILTGIVMMLVVLRYYFQKDIFWVAIIGESLALLVGNMLAYANLRRRIAEVLFVADSISVISMYDLLYRQPQKSFPLRLANPVRVNEGIQIHYKDQIITLASKDWDEIDVIWEWLTSNHEPSGYTYTVR